MIIFVLVNFNFGVEKFEFESVEDNFGGGFGELIFNVVYGLVSMLFNF